MIVSGTSEAKAIDSLDIEYLFPYSLWMSLVGSNQVPTMPPIVEVVASRAMFASFRLYYGEFRSADEMLQTLYIVGAIDLHNDPQLCITTQQNDRVDDMH